jgi:hypothetical protein
MPSSKRRGSPCTKPSYDSVVRDGRLTCFDLRPPTVQFGNVFSGRRLQRGGKCCHFGNKFGNRQPPLRRSRFEGDSGPFVDFDEAFGGAHKGKVAPIAPNLKKTCPPAPLNLHRPEIEFSFLRVTGPERFPNLVDNLQLIRNHPLTRPSILDIGIRGGHMHKSAVLSRPAFDIFNKRLI